MDRVSDEELIRILLEAYKTFSVQVESLKGCRLRVKARKDGGQSDLETFEAVLTPKWCEEVAELSSFLTNCCVVVKLLHNRALAMGVAENR